jgi:hypothetical protein
MVGPAEAAQSIGLEVAMTSRAVLNDRADTFLPAHDDLDG